MGIPSPSRLLLPVAVVGLALLGAAAAFALVRRAPAAPVTVKVKMVDFRFELSRKQVPAGSVRFVVTNKGSTLHDFAIGKVKTRLLKPGQSQTIVARFPKAARVAYRCTVAGHAALGMKGTLVVGKPKAPPPTTTTTTAQQTADLALTPIGTFDRPDFVTSPPGDTERLFVVEQAGVIRVIDDGVLRPAPFLDISYEVQEANETGLLGLAFPPDYATSGLFYVMFNRHEGNGNLYLEEFRRSANDPDVADPSTVRVVLEIVKPYENHNAGMLQFGPDGDLYVAVGDGDSGVLNPPGAFAQTLDDLLGNILRIDPAQAGDEPYTVPGSNPFVGVAGDQPEILDYGFRNPWRFWVDPATGDLYIGDVGEGTREEIDYQAAGHAGLNFGWPCFEGTVVFDPTAVCNDPVAPLLDYGHQTNECAVIGGVVLHDSRLPALDGWFLYSDLCAGELDALHVEDGTLAGTQDLKLNVPGVDSFGMDALGRAYVVSVNGPIYRIDPASP
ncbi:MAG TPA: PQQ-dependent sugar dehydrogenase [Gaiellaceae bacterium]|nr:PQQ-dependent sugar dehydrogenase [Gaiellaceae bacterium]